MKYNRFLPLVIPLFILAMLQLYYFKHNLIYVVISLILLSLFFSIRQFLLAGNSNERWYNFFIPPAILTVSVVVFTTMQTNKIFIQSLIFGNALLLYFYLRILYQYLVYFDLRRKEALENFSTYGNFLAFYFATASLYGIHSFLNFAIWPLILIFIATSSLIIYQVFWVYNINFKISLFYVLLLALTLTELAWSATFLTLSYYVLGLIITVAYYILIGITKSFLKHDIDKKVVKLYLLFGLASIFIVLLTARWV